MVWKQAASWLRGDGKSAFGQMGGWEGHWLSSSVLDHTS